MVIRLGYWLDRDTFFLFEERRSLYVEKFVSVDKTVVEVLDFGFLAVLSSAVLYLQQSICLFLVYNKS